MKQKLSTGKKLAFAAADIFGGGSFNIINFLYPGFLALTLGLSPYWISFVMLVARLWDAISDPLMGKISDATSSKMGKRRIYLVIASPLVLISLVLMFFPWAFPSVALRVTAALLSYLLFCTVQTMVMIPYYSLSSEISSDYQERASANSFRLGFSIFSSILCVALPGMIVSMFPDNRGYIVMGIVFGILFGLSVLVTGLFAREEIKSPPIHTNFDYGQFSRLLHLKPFRHYFGMFLTLQMTMAIMSGLFFFLIDFYLCRDLTAQGKGNALGLIGAALMFSMQIVALPVYLKMIKKTSKAFTYRAGALLWIISALAIFLMKPGQPDYYLYLLAALMGFGISAPGLVPHTMFGDVADAAELAYGKRNEGLMSGWVNFLNKVVQAAGLAAVMSLIGFFGFKEAQIGGPPVTAQPLSAQLALRNIMALSPLILMGIGIIISFSYKIDSHKQADIQTALQDRQGDEAQRLIAEFTDMTTQGE